MVSLVVLGNSWNWVVHSRCTNRIRSPKVVYVFLFGFFPAQQASNVHYENSSFILDMVKTAMATKLSIDNKLS